MSKTASLLFANKFDNTEWYQPTLRCSKCSVNFMIESPEVENPRMANYCPNCGAKFTTSRELPDEMRSFPNPKQLAYNKHLNIARRSMVVGELQNTLTWAYRFGVVDIANVASRRLLKIAAEKRSKNLFKTGE